MNRARHGHPVVPDPAVQELLQPGQSIALLQELHILTRDGKLNQDSRRKLKQVSHLIQLLEPSIRALQVQHPDGVDLVDHGAGKSYLGFLLYDLIWRHQSGGTIWGVEAREALVQRCVELARQLGFARMRFLATQVADAGVDEGIPREVAMVTALHACDSATDDAIAFALQRKAQCIALVPCCHAEMARVLTANKALALARTPLAELWRHPLHTREFGAQVTNVARCLYLQAQGYQVRVTELVGWEHSLKNELILAQYTGQRSRAARQRLDALVAELGLESWAELHLQ